MQCDLNVDFSDVRGSSANDDTGRAMANSRAMKGVNVVFMVFMVFMIFKALGESLESRSAASIVGIK